MKIEVIHEHVLSNMLVNNGFVQNLTDSLIILGLTLSSTSPASDKLPFM